MPKKELKPVKAKKVEQVIEEVVEAPVEVVEPVIEPVIEPVADQSLVQQAEVIAQEFIATLPQTHVDKQAIKPILVSLVKRLFPKN